MNSNKISFLIELEQMPVIKIACQKAGVSRATVYRWKEEDEEFAQAMFDALHIGYSEIADDAEEKLIDAVKKAEWRAIKMVLQHRHAAYGSASSRTGTHMPSRIYLNKQRQRDGVPELPPEDKYFPNIHLGKPPATDELL